MKSYGYVKASEGSVDNLHKLFNRADKIDRREGMVAFQRYNSVMGKLGNKYAFSIERTTAAFVAMSPNNDYLGNLRAVVSVMNGINEGTPCAKIKAACYNHCRDRAYGYLKHNVDFLSTAQGPKIRAFYETIVNPEHRRAVTVDGHMVCAWLGRDLPMKFALLRGQRAYETIADGVREVARERGLLPNQAQAIIWFARKRTAKSKYDPQLDLFYQDDAWKTLVNVDDIKPYGANA